MNRLILTLAIILNLGLSACDNSEVTSIPSNNMDIGQNGTVESIEDESAKRDSENQSDTLVQGAVDDQVSSGVRDDDMVKDDDGVSASSVQAEKSRTLKIKEI